jgi:hypothetical protein
LPVCRVRFPRSAIRSRSPPGMARLAMLTPHAYNLLHEALARGA